MNEVCIVAAQRTPQGKFLGALQNQTAVDLATHAGAATLRGIGAENIDQLIIGNVLSAGQGMNIARQIGVRLGLPLSVPAFTVNMMCASGMQAVILAAQAIRAGEARVVLCGGTESMSNAPYLLPRARTGYKLGDATVQDSLLGDGLVDAFDHEHMALSTERLAAHYQISRTEQDAFAARSQQRYAAAHAAGTFAAELVTVGKLDRDEHPRPETTVETLSKLKPSFKPDGTITAGNASGINDGASLLVVCDHRRALEKGWPVLAKIRASASIGCDPKWMGLGPVHATRRLCEQSGLTPDQFDSVEINEAFAAQTLACLRELQLDENRVNPHGGAIALGHPIGASGARLITHLAHCIAQGKSKLALATLCVGGGMGSAVALARAD